MNLDSWCLITNVSEVKLPRYLIVGHVALETQFRDGRKEEQLAIPSRPLSHFGTMLLQLLLLVKQLFSRLLAIPFAFIIAATAATCSISVIIQAVARACVSAVLHLSSWIRGSVNCTHWDFCLLIWTDPCAHGRNPTSFILVMRSRFSIHVLAKWMFRSCVRWASFRTNGLITNRIVSTPAFKPRSPYVFPYLSTRYYCIIGTGRTLLPIKVRRVDLLSTLRLLVSLCSSCGTRQAVGTVIVGGPNIN